MFYKDLIKPTKSIYKSLIVNTQQQNRINKNPTLKYINVGF